MRMASAGAEAILVNCELQPPIATLVVLTGSS